MASRSTATHTAAPSVAGCLFQLERAMVHLAEPANDAVAVEHLDDVATFQGTALAAQEQDKHTVIPSKKVLSDRSAGLWRTLQIWVHQRRVGGYCAKYLIACNSEIAGRIVDRIKALEANEGTPLDIVAALREVGQSRGRATRSKIQAIIEEARRSQRPPNFDRQVADIASTPHGSAPADLAGWGGDDRQTAIEDNRLELRRAPGPADPNAPPMISRKPLHSGQQWPMCFTVRSVGSRAPPHMPSPHGLPRNILIVGASGGIGAALIEAARRRYNQSQMTAWSRLRPMLLPDAVAWTAVDVTDESRIAAAAASLAELDLVIVATGLLQRDTPPPGLVAVRPEKSWRSLDPAAMAESFAINAIAPAIIAKHVLPRLARDRRAVFAVLSARVGSISDNRLGGWHSYRAAKAALNQIIRTLSIELSAKAPSALCVGLHPGTVDTPLSKPFQSGVVPDKLFTPAQAANQLLDVLESRTNLDTGEVFDWAGLRVPP